MFSDFVNTNYVPLPHEVDQLRIAIQDEKQKVALLEDEIKKLHQRLDVLNQHKSAHTKKAEEYAALLSPVRALPPEILGKIFLACLDAYMEDAAPSRLGKHPAHILGQVCRLWRDTVLETPEMWSVIDISLPVHPFHIIKKRYRMTFDDLPTEEQKTWTKRSEDWERRIHSVHDMLQLYLARSADRPLTISFNAKRVHPSPTDEDECILIPLLDTLLSAFERFEEIAFKLRLEDASCPLNELIAMAWDGIPLLRRARYDIKLGPTVEEEFVNQQFLCFTGPRLTCFDLNMRWYFLRILEIGVDWSILTDLRLCTLGREDILTPDVPSVMEILRRCPRLVRCALEIEHDGRVNELPDHTLERYPISLPHIRYLTVYGYGAHLFLSRALEMPSLEEVHALQTRRNPYNGAAEETPDGIYPWAEKYGSQLKSVSFEYGYLSQLQLLQTLAKLEAVVALKLNGKVDYAKVMPDEGVDEEERARWILPARLNDAVLRSLIPPFGYKTPPFTTPCSCPKLRRLECIMGDLDFNEQGFVDLIVCRRMAMESESGIERLEEAVLVFGTLKTLDFRSKLEKRGVDVDAFGLRVEYASEG